MKSAMHSSTSYSTSCSSSGKGSHSLLPSALAHKLQHDIITRSS
jgi:hypothetical protein